MGVFVHRNGSGPLGWQNDARSGPVRLSGAGTCPGRGSWRASRTCAREGISREGRSREGLDRTPRMSPPGGPARLAEDARGAAPGQGLRRGRAPGRWRGSPGAAPRHAPGETGVHPRRGQPAARQGRGVVGEDLHHAFDDLLHAGQAAERLMVSVHAHRKRIEARQREAGGFVGVVARPAVVSPDRGQPARQGIGQRAVPSPPPCSAG